MRLLSKLFRSKNNKQPEDYKIISGTLLTIIGGIQSGEDKSNGSRSVKNIAFIKASARQENVIKL